MGRHAAADDAPVHPLVAEALARRPAEAEAAHRPPSSTETVGEPGPIGWPGPDPDAEPGGAPIGWPGGMTDEPATRPDASAPAEQAGTAVLTVGTPPRRRGWWRFFGGGDRAA